MSMGKNRRSCGASLIRYPGSVAALALLPGVLAGSPALAQAPGEPPGAVVTGALSRELVHNTILPHIGEVRSCVDTGIAAELQLGGEVTVHFKIAASGSVSSVRIEPSPLRDPHIERCLLKHLKSWAFPKASGGGTKVTYHFELFATTDEVSAKY